ncbi:MAG: M20/M25/M40 family metallo-hydrolase [Chloroflexota bacterium]
MEPRALDFRQRLLDAPGPSGYESAPARVWRAEAATFADRVDFDLVGNSFATVKGSGAGPKVLIAGHIDEIGFVITHVDDNGSLWFEPLGGWDAQVVVGQRIRVLGTGGDVIGVIGKKAIHLMKPEDRSKPSELSDLWIDIGAASRDEALARVEPGCAAVIDGNFVRLTDDRCAARSMDNRVGAFVALETVRLLSAERPRVEVVAVATVQEENAFVGAHTAAVREAPAVAIALDVTHATDYPGANKQRDGEVTIGGGPVLTRGASINPVVYEGLRAAARRIGVTCPLQATGGRSGTDADAMIRSGPGMATGLVSLPNRYMHSPNEVVSLQDLVDAARVIAEFVRSIGPDSDFRPA